MVVTRDDVPEGGQSFLYPLDGDRIRKGVPEVLKLLIVCC